MTIDDSLVVPDLAGGDFASEFTPAPKIVDFAEVVLDDAGSITTCLNPIELETGGVKLRLDANTGVGRIVELISALKAVL